MSSSNPKKSVVRKIGKFKNFMKQHEIEKDKTGRRKYIDAIYSHTDLGEPWGKYFIPTKDYGKFLKLYCRVRKYMDHHIIERTQEIGPLLMFKVPVIVLFPVELTFEPLLKVAVGVISRTLTVHT